MEMFIVWTKELDDDDVVLTDIYQNRYSQLRKNLPKQGVMGYITVSRPNDEGDILAKYYLTQFELTPLIISSDVNRHLIIGDLNNGNEVKQVKEKYNFRILAEFPNGVALFESGDMNK